jgi:archaellum component FlaC
MDTELKAALEDIREAIRKLDRKVDDLRASYEHHTAQESRVHGDIQKDFRSYYGDLKGDVARFNAGIEVLSRDLGRIDERVGILESAV